MQNKTVFANKLHSVSNRNKATAAALKNGIIAVAALNKQIVVNKQRAANVRRAVNNQVVLNQMATDQMAANSGSKEIILKKMNMSGVPVSSVSASGSKEIILKKMNMSGI